MSGFYVCNQCQFRVPADPIGVELMKQHLNDHRKEAKMGLDTLVHVGTGGEQ